MEALRPIIDLVAASEMSPFLMISILILAGVLGGWVATLIRLPHITGNILGGLLVGPACLGVIRDHSDIVSLQPLSTFAMSLIAVSIGGHLSYRRIHNSIRRIVSISIMEVGCTVSLVIVVARLFHMDWPMSLMLGAISAATAPATTIALIRELRCKGPFVKTLVSVVALDNIFCILLFVMMRTFVSAYYESGDTAGQIDEALLLSAYHLLGAGFLGFLAGWISKKLVSIPKFHDFSTILMAIMVCDGLASYLGLSPLLVNLFFGVYLGNSSEVAEKQLTTLEPLAPILYICFFTLAGASLHLDSMMEVGGMALVYFASRFVGKGLGAALGGVLGKCSRRLWQNMSFSLVPQAGIAIGLVVLLDADEHMPREMTNAVGAIILAAVTINEIVGPFFTKAALIRSKEHGRDRERLVEFMAEEFIMVDLKATDQWDAIRQLTAFLMRTHRVEHITQEELYQTIIDREKQMSTGMGEGIALPHGRIKKGRSIQGVIGISREGIDFDAPDGKPVKLIMLIVTPESAKNMHLKVMGSLSAMVSDETVRNRLIAAISPEDAMEVIESEEARGFNYFLD
ncbi:MAG: PTS sugar transporter subunit IIA [Pontiella sp.]